MIRSLVRLHFSQKWRYNRPINKPDIPVRISLVLAIRYHFQARRHLIQYLILCEACIDNNLDLARNRLRRIAKTGCSRLWEQLLFVFERLFCVGKGLLVFRAFTMPSIRVIVCWVGLGLGGALVLCSVGVRRFMPILMFLSQAHCDCWKMRLREQSSLFLGGLSLDK